MLATIILSAFGFFLFLWLIGFVVFSYHVFSYGLPGDATKKVFYVFLSLSIMAIIAVIYFLAGINWKIL